jgi:GNAT superfamily N-acetyltransferase
VSHEEEPFQVVCGSAEMALRVFAACGMNKACADLADGLAPDEVCLVATSGRTTAGAAVGRLASVAYEADCEVTYSVLELLAVRPGSRRLGIGTRLIEAFAAAAARMGASSVHLMVAPAEEAGLAAFYQARGFQAIEEGHWERHLT